MQSFLTLTGGSHQILRRGRDIMLIPRGSVIGPIPLQLFIPYIYIYIYIYIHIFIYHIWSRCLIPLSRAALTVIPMRIIIRSLSATKGHFGSPNVSQISTGG